MIQALIGKVPISSTLDATFGAWCEPAITQLPGIDRSTGKISNADRDAYKLKHTAPILYGTNPAGKLVPYLTRANGKAYLQLLYKEMRHNGTSWGDDGKFNVVDSESTTTDLNAQTVKIGQRRVPLPFFIGDGE